MLRPRFICIPAVRILAEEPAGSRLVETRVHILQAGGLVVHAAGKGHFVQEFGRACLALYVVPMYNSVILEPLAYILFSLVSLKYNPKTNIIKI